MSKILFTDIESFWLEASTTSRPKVHANGDMTFHVNHDGCPAGTDTKRRLYLTEEAATGTLLAYCHHCGDSGFLPKKESVAHINKTLGWEPSGYIRAGTILSCDRCHDYPVDSAAHEWLAKYLRTTTIRDKLWAQSDFDTSSCCPIDVKYLGETIGVQVRDLAKKPKQKYRTYFTDKYEPHRHGDTLRGWLSHAPHEPKAGVVICEDMVSGYKIFYESGTNVDVYVLLGSHMSNQDFLTLRKHYKQVLVMLDNDNGVVNREAERIVKMFEMIGARCERSFASLDPKQYHPDGLKRIIEETMIL